MSLSDGGIQPTMPVMPAGNSGGFGGFGGDNGAWWLIVLFLFIFAGGWNNNGFGNNGGGVTDGYVLTSDFANIERKLDGINNGICDSTFALNNSVKDGFSGITQTVTTGFSNAELSRCNQQAALMQQLNSLQAQIASCCCDTREAIQGANYNLATQACDTRNLIQNSTRDIIEASNQNGKAILDFLVNSKMQDLQSENQSLKLAASQAAQNDTLKSYMSGQFAYYNPRPVPSFAVPAPYQYAGCGC